MEPIVILLAFANDQQAYLAHLQQEMYDIYDALWPLRKSGTAKVEIGMHASRDKLFRYFANEEFRKQIQIFHYAGHAGSLGLKLEDGQVFAKGLADQLRGIDLVVLNGCATKGQLQYFKNQQVRALIATPEQISDGKARVFAAAFYRSLAEFNKLPEAFRFAFSVLKSLFPQSWSATDELGWNDAGNVLSLQGEEEYEEDAYLPTSQAAAGWELHIFDAEMKQWDISQSQPEREAYKQQIELLRKKEKIAYRFLRIGDFGQVREKIRPIIQNPAAEVRAGAFWVQGVDEFQHYWVSGNVLNDLLEFRNINYLHPVNIDLLPEADLSAGSLQQKPHASREVIRYLLKKIWTWRELDEQLITPDYHLEAELDNLLTDLSPILAYQPLAMRIYDKLGLCHFPAIMQDVYEQFWKKLCAKLTAQVQARGEVLNPLVLFFIDLSQSISPDETLSRHRQILEKEEHHIAASGKMLLLDNFPEIDAAFIQRWQQAEASDPTLSENIIGRYFEQKYQQDCNYYYHLGTSGHTRVEIFFKKICADFQLNIELEDPVSYRLMALKPRQSQIDRIRARAMRRHVQNF